MRVYAGKTRDFYFRSVTIGDDVSIPTFPLLSKGSSLASPYEPTLVHFIDIIDNEYRVIAFNLFPLRCTCSSAFYFPPAGRIVIGVSQGRRVTKGDGCGLLVTERNE